MSKVSVLSGPERRWTMVDAHAMIIAERAARAKAVALAASAQAAAVNAEADAANARADLSNTEALISHYNQSIAKPNGWIANGEHQQRESVRGFWNAFQHLRHI